MAMWSFATKIAVAGRDVEFAAEVVTARRRPVAVQRLDDVEPVRCSSSRQPRMRSMASGRSGGPARCRMRVCPSSTRWRTAARAPRYWSIETMRGLRRADRGDGDERDAEVEAAHDLEHRDVDDDEHDRVDPLAQQGLDDRPDARGVGVERADGVDAVARRAGGEVEVHRDRGGP